MKVITFRNSGRPSLYKVFTFQHQGGEYHLTLLSFWFPSEAIILDVGDMMAHFESSNRWYHALRTHLGTHNVSYFADQIGVRRFPPTLPSEVEIDWMARWLRSLDPGMGPVEGDRVVGNWSHTELVLAFENRARRQSAEPFSQVSQGGLMISANAPDVEIVSLLTFRTPSPDLHTVPAWTVFRFQDTGGALLSVMRHTFRWTGAHLRALGVPALNVDGVPRQEAVWHRTLMRELAREGIRPNRDDGYRYGRRADDQSRIDYLNDLLTGAWRDASFFDRAVLQMDYSTPGLAEAWMEAHPATTRRQVVLEEGSGGYQPLPDLSDSGRQRLREAVFRTTENLNRLSEVAARVNVTGFGRLQDRMAEVKAILERQEQEMDAEMQAEMEQRTQEAKRPLTRSSAIELPPQDDGEGP